jgi:hypothetical protein
MHMSVKASAGPVWMSGVGAKAEDICSWRGFLRLDPKQSSVRASQIETLWNVLALNHSGLMPADLITLAYFSVSSAISFPKSAGEPASTVPPRSASRALILGSARAALISLLSLSTISVGAFLGAPRPNTELAS